MAPLTAPVPSIRSAPSWPRRTSRSRVAIPLARRALIASAARAGSSMTASSRSTDTRPDGRWRRRTHGAMLARDALTQPATASHPERLFYTGQVRRLAIVTERGGAGTGRQGRLKLCCPKGRVGSTPTRRKRSRGRRASRRRSDRHVSKMRDSVPSTPTCLRAYLGLQAVQLSVARADPTLGVDGMLRAGPRGVWKLRIFQDAQYTAIIERTVRSIGEVSPHRAGQARRTGCVEIDRRRKHWICLFPQLGPGPKHRRRIVLAPWQAVHRRPGDIRGEVRTRRRAAVVTGERQGALHRALRGARQGSARHRPTHRVGGGRRQSGRDGDVRRCRARHRGVQRRDQPDEPAGPDLRFR